MASSLLQRAEEDGKTPATKATELIVAALNGMEEGVIPADTPPIVPPKAGTEVVAPGPGHLPAHKEKNGHRFPFLGVVCCALLAGLMSGIGYLLVRTPPSEGGATVESCQHREQLSAAVSTLETSNRILADRVARDKEDAVLRRLDRIEAAERARQRLNAALSSNDSDPYEVRPIAFPAMNLTSKAPSK